MTVFVLHGRQENCQGRDRPVEILCALRKRAHIERNEARARIDFSTTSPGHLSRVTCAVRARGHRTHTHTFGGAPRRKNNIKILAVLQRACQLAFSLSLSLSLELLLNQNIRRARTRTHLYAAGTPPPPPPPSKFIPNPFIAKSIFLENVNLG